MSSLGTQMVLLGRCTVVDWDSVRNMGPVLSGEDAKTYRSRTHCGIRVEAGTRCYIAFWGSLGTAPLELGRASAFHSHQTLAPPCYLVGGNWCSWPCICFWVTPASWLGRPGSWSRSPVWLSGGGIGHHFRWRLGGQICLFGFGRFPSQKDIFGVPAGFNGKKKSCQKHHQKFVGKQTERKVCRSIYEVFVLSVVVNLINRVFSEC